MLRLLAPLTLSSKVPPLPMTSFEATVAPLPTPCTYSVPLLAFQVLVPFRVSVAPPRMNLALVPSSVAVPVTFN